MAASTPLRIRRGLPRTPGGPAWPDVDTSALEMPTEPTALSPTTAPPSPAVNAPAAGPTSSTPPSPAPTSGVAAPEPGPITAAQGTLRQGLPRTPGGEPWPPSETAAVERTAPATPTTEVSAGTPTTEVPVVATPSVSSPTAGPEASAAAQVALRRGLPRTPGGEPWPPSGTATVQRAEAATPTAHVAAAETAAAATPAIAPPTVATAHASEPAPATETLLAPTAAEPAPIPRPQQPAVAKPAPAPSSEPAPAPEADPAPRRWARRVSLWVLGAIGAAGIIVLAARGVTTLPGVPEFMERFPGEYAPRVPVDPGFPGWARWAHYLNFFFMVLIVRSGLLVRTQQRPDAYFTPKKGGKKISLYLWLHTSIDILWLVNGITFVVLLFASGHWARIVPTSWEVFPNALSAGLQYLTLEWPHEDGWVNFNSLQQLMYFTVVFIAAPLAAITGVRMSEWWPENAQKLNRLYPAPVARAIHFPVMLFFVLFVIAHVFLVFTTGALKNLNHMFAGTPEISWVGFGLFALGLLVAAAVTWAARPLVIAPIANLFGRVSER